MLKYCENISVTTKTVKIVLSFIELITNKTEMDLKRRINAFVRLGEEIRSLSSDELKRLAINAEAKNAWFTEENVLFAFRELGAMLNEGNLNEWLSEYDFDDLRPINVGIVAAGNIPMVGFHDLMSTLLSGHRALVKLSSDDNYLIKSVLSILYKLEPEFKEMVQIVEMLKEADAFIATGSNNSSRYFEYYFSSKPNIIRKNRSSVAVLTGKETPDVLEKLGEDVFRYFGLGCRNVSKIYIPMDYKPDPVFEALESWNTLADHNKFANNFHYNRSIYLLSKEKFFENGFFIMKEADGHLVAPVSVLYMERYADQADLESKLDGLKDDLQCIASHNKWYKNSLEIGDLQQPKLNDYADGVDTMAFLTGLK